jgi:phosphoribosylaminoimidazolecarboxamide formyltransferase/IMP cyclohydrolase
MKTALLASYEKDEALKRLGRLLIDNGWTLLGSAGTAKYLMDNSIPCRDVAGIVGPPILGHRVVTLAREVYAGLLFATPEDAKEIRQLGIAPIDLVYVTLYPLEAVVADPRRQKMLSKDRLRSCAPLPGPPPASQTPTR